MIDRFANYFPGVRLPRAAISFLAAALFFGPGLATAADHAANQARIPAQISEQVLANGMKVIVWTDRDIPNVALYNWVRVGSRNEAPGITGLAHFFEHMMFNGTARRAAGEFDAEMEARGGANNAFTSNDVTVYQDWFPSSALEAIFELEGDRLANLAFKNEVVESERNVVYSERRLRTEDNNQGFLYEQVQATAFVAHPYQIPTIGWPADIRAWRLEDLQQFYRTYYAPNNCTLIVVGAVEADEVFALARRYLEPIPRQEPPRPVVTQEPEQLGEKRVVVERRAQTPLLQVSYKSPAARDPANAALNLLVTVLAGNDASRLRRALVEDQKVAIDVSAYWDEALDPSLLSFFLTLPEGGNPAAAEAALDRELATIVASGITAAELRRAQNIAVTSFWKGLATINGKAMGLGQAEVFFGDWRRLFSASSDYEKVTTQQVQAVAARVLRKQVRTVGVLVPTATGAGDAN